MHTTMVDQGGVPELADSLAWLRREQYALPKVPPLTPSPKRGRRSRAPATRGNRAALPIDHVSRAYHDLREAILWGQLPPGAPISERSVAERLGLSRTPVRSALHRLEQEGFVAAFGRGRERRLIAAPLTRDDGQELFLIIGHLEGMAARIAAMLPAARRREVVSEMRSLNRELASGPRLRRDARHFFDLDFAFHRTYVEGVGGPRLLTLHRAIKPQSERYTRLYVSVLLDELPTSVAEHEMIARHIARGDPEASQAAAETNWHNAADRLGRIITEHGERGSWHAWGREVARGDTGLSTASDQSIGLGRALVSRR